jgi:thioesterase DpgC
MALRSLSCLQIKGLNIMNTQVLSEQIAQWATTLPPMTDVFDDDKAALTQFCDQAEWLIKALGAKCDMSQPQLVMLNTVLASGRKVRQQFCARHALLLAQTLCGQTQAHRSLSDFAYAGAALVPGLLPNVEQMAVEQALVQQPKLGREADQGIFFSQLLAHPQAGKMLLEAQLLPTQRALTLLTEFESGELIDLGKVTIELKGDGAHVTFVNPEVLNAEDNQLIASFETAVDLALLSDKVRVGILRGGVVTHPRYRNKRIFSAGINLKHINQGKLAYADFLMGRELGYIHKMIRGIQLKDGDECHSIEKPWIGVVDTFAIGGGMQLLFACDLVIAADDSYACLPAANEGIVPGVSNLRLPRMASGRLAQQVILHGKRIFATSAEATLVFDQVVTQGQMAQTISDGIKQMAASAVIPNRRMLRISQEPLSLFQSYMAEFAMAQVERLYSLDVADKTARFISKNSTGENK